MSEKRIPKRALGSTGIDVTELGFGGGPVGNLHRAISDDDAIRAVTEAWIGGIRYFDTAPLYGFGLSERRIGAALAGRPRQAFVISTKVGRLLRRPRQTGRNRHGFVDAPDLEAVFDYSYDGTKRSIEESLDRLRLEYVDIALIHDIDRWTHADEQAAVFGQALDGAYRALSDLKSENRIRAVGLGVNEWEVCRAFADRVPIDCVLLAGRHTLLEQEASHEFFPFCLDRDIGVIVGGPFNSGILATGAVSSALYNYRPAPDEILDRTAQIERLAARFGISIYSAALSFTLRHPVVTSVIPGLQSCHEVRAAVASHNGCIPEPFWQALAEHQLIDEA